jgi:hypothetical protein
MTWREDRTRSCQVTGNNNHGTSFSAIAKKKINFFLFAGPAVLNQNTSKNCFWTPLHLLVCETMIKVMARGSGRDKDKAIA